MSKESDIHAYRIYLQAFALGVHGGNYGMSTAEMSDAQLCFAVAYGARDGKAANSPKPLSELVEKMRAAGV